MRYITFIVIFISCVSDNPWDCRHGQRQQCTVEAIVWNQYYQRKEEAPGVEWLYDNKNFIGNFTSGTYTIIMTWQGDWYRSAELYTHEMMHAYLNAVKPWTLGDYYHTEPEWKTLQPAAKEAVVNFMRKQDGLIKHRRHK